MLAAHVAAVVPANSRNFNPEELKSGRLGTTKVSMTEPDNGVNFIDLVENARQAAAAPAVEMFKVYSSAYTCQRAVNKLQEMQRSSKNDSWSEVEVCTVGEGDSQRPKLKCKHCSTLLSVSNPAQTLKTHLTERACSGLRRLASASAAAAAATAAAAGGSAGGSSSTNSSTSSIGSSVSAAAGTDTTKAISLQQGTGKRKKGSGISIMCATAHQQQCFERSIARFFFKNGIPLQLTEDVDLRAAVAHVGLLPPSRHDLSNRLLNEEYDAVRAVDVNRLAQQKLIQLSSDGWRRRAAVRGVPLINFMALMPVGAPIFCKVVSAAGEVKDKNWIAALHLEIAAEITGGKLERVLGFVMDNTKANM
jgi:hypothetical protein